MHGHMNVKLNMAIVEIRMLWLYINPCNINMHILMHRWIQVNVLFTSSTQYRNSPEC